MKKHLFSAIFLALSISGFAQNSKTGIDIKDPQQTLHVAGPAGTLTAVGTTGVFIQKPTVRVEGLNSTNNTAHNASDGTSSLKRVYANQTGDLVLVNGNLEQQVFVQEIGDVIPTNEILSITGLLGSYQNVELKSVTFTLDHPSVVYFSASFAALVSFAGGATVTDGRAKLFGAYFQFSATDNGVSTTATFGNNKKTYANQVASGVKDDFVLNPRAKLVLPKGTYTVKLYGEMFSSLLSLLGRTQFGGGTTGENFLINATPIQYQ